MNFRNRLLVVDDDPDTRDLFQEIANGVGFSVEAASNRVEFENSYQEFKPSVILLDLQMPETDGVELLRYLATYQSDAQILLISGFDSRIRSSALQIGKKYGLSMIGTLQKPVYNEDLERLLRTTFEKTRSITEADLQKAIEDDQFIVHYQPKTDLRSGVYDIVELEALVRWNHPIHGMLLPNRFIPIMEKTGLIQPLTNYVLQTAVQQLRCLQENSLPLSIAINISPQSLTELDFPDYISSQLQEYRVDPSRLLLEITESGAMADAAQTLDIATRFRLKGFGLSMDDFGTGYSSLIQLYRIPFNELKIDKSFVLDIDDSEEAKIIAQLTVDLARRLKLSVCGEGVETRAALKFLSSIGCDKAQGYLIGKPVPAAEIPAIIHNWKQKVQRFFRQVESYRLSDERGSFSRDSAPCMT